MLQNSFPLFLAYCTYLPTQSTNIKVQIYKAFTLYNTNTSVMFLLRPNDPKVMILKHYTKMLTSFNTVHKVKNQLGVFTCFKPVLIKIWQIS